MDKYKISANVSAYKCLEELYDFSQIDVLIGEASYSLDFSIENTFLHKKIDIAVITNVYEDHIDGEKIKDQEDLLDKKMFVIRNLKKGGTVLLGTNNKEKNIAYKAEVYIKKYRKDINVIKIGNTYSDDNVNDLCVLKKNIYYKKKKLIDTSTIPFAFEGNSPIININIAFMVGILQQMSIHIDNLLSIKSLNEVVKGRMNFFCIGENKVYLDFAHEPQSIYSIVNFIKNYEQAQVTGIIRLSYYRKNEEIIKTTKKIAGLFNKIYIYDKAVSNKELREIYLNKEEKYLGEVGEIMCKVCEKEIGKKNVNFIPEEYECVKRTIRENEGKNIILYIGGDDLTKSIQNLEKFQSNI